MFSAVLFDMDGVLIDSQPLHYLGDQMTLAAYGVEVGLEEMTAYAGTTNSLRFQLFKERYEIPEEVDVMITKRETIMIRLVEESDLDAVKGVRAFLEDLKENKVPLAVASSSSYEFIYAVLDKLNISAYFDLVLSGEEVPAGKPAPDIFLEAASRLQVEPKDCVVVEDSSNGVQAAVNAGMFCIGYRNPTSGKQDLSLANKIIDDFNCLSFAAIKHYL